MYTFVIPSSKQKYTTGTTNIHTHTHTTSNNYKHKATGHNTFLANGHFAGSEAHFVCEIPTASSNKKGYNFADTGLAVGTPASFDLMKACFKRMCWFGNWHKTDAFTKLGEPTIRAACTLQIVLDQNF